MYNDNSILDYTMCVVSKHILAPKKFLKQLNHKDGLTFLASEALCWKELSIKKICVLVSAGSSKAIRFF